MGTLRRREDFEGGLAISGISSKFARSDWGQATCSAFRCARTRLVERSLDTRTGTILARSIRFSARSWDRTQTFYTNQTDQLGLRAFGIAVEGKFVDEALPSASEVRQDVFHVLELVEVRSSLELAPSGIRADFAT